MLYETCVYYTVSLMKRSTRIDGNVNKKKKKNPALINTQQHRTVSHRAMQLSIQPRLLNISRGRRLYLPVFLRHIAQLLLLISAFISRCVCFLAIFLFEDALRGNRSFLLAANQSVPFFFMKKNNPRITNRQAIPITELPQQCRKQLGSPKLKSLNHVAQVRLGNLKYVVISLPLDGEMF